MSSVTVRSPRDRAALTALALPSSSTSWQLMSVTSFLCIGRDRSEVEPLVAVPVMKEVDVYSDVLTLFPLHITYHTSQIRQGS